MADALERVSDPKLREQLQLIRNLYGQVLTSEDLQRQIKGFQGQKGIYKPAGAEQALWVRQTRRGIYPDKELSLQPDGSWTFLYAPEGRDGQTDLTLDTNRALLTCKSTGSPVGVFRQTTDVLGRTAYDVLGLARVEAYDGEHFVLRGEPIDWTSAPIPEEVVPTFSPFQVDGPSMVESLRIARDSRFSVALRRVYHERCALCQVGYRVKGQVVGVEAAHIIPVQDGGVISDLRNGMLLCKNHHALFDRFAWTFDGKLEVRVSPDREFRESALANHLLGWEGKRLANLPTLDRDLPAPEAIDWRERRFDEAWP
ncbi:MAG: HNH endonuclease [Thermoplasmata archaeon]|nr:HNH endonuclease [Thermoplasmata archaeon]